MFGHTAGFNRLKPGIDFLQADRRRHREQTFQELVGYWSELGHRRLLGRIDLDGRRWPGANPSPANRPVQRGRSGRMPRSAGEGHRRRERSNLTRRRCSSAGRRGAGAGRQWPSSVRHAQRRRG